MAGTWSSGAQYMCLWFWKFWRGSCWRRALLRHGAWNESWQWPQRWQEQRYRKVEANGCNKSQKLLSLGNKEFFPNPPTNNNWTEKWTEDVNNSQKEKQMNSKYRRINNIQGGKVWGLGIFVCCSGVQETQQCASNLMMLRWEHPRSSVESSKKLETKMASNRGPAK